MKNIFFLFSVTFMLSSCSNIYYQSDFLVELDPYQYKTYYTEVQCDDDVNPITAQRIRNAIDIEAREFGYEKNDNGDLLIKYLIKNTSRKFIEECTQEYGRFRGGEFCRERIVTYKEGSLIMDIINTDTNEIIWHGAAYGPSFDSWGNADKMVNEMVGKLFERYRNNVK